MPAATAWRLKFTVPGAPVSQGSKDHKGHGILVESAKGLAAWRQRIAIVAHNAMAGAGLLPGPISMSVLFVLPRPKSTPKRHTPPAIHRPDVDKLARAVFDAITHVVIGNDAQIINLCAAKRLAELGEAPHADITIWESQ